MSLTLAGSFLAHAGMPPNCHYAEEDQLENAPQSVSASLCQHQKGSPWCQVLQPL